MNILFCSRDGNLKGAPLSLLSLANTCMDDGHKCTMLIGSSGLMLNRCEQANVKYDVIPDLYNPVLTPPIFEEMLSRIKPDLVFINTILGFPLVRILCNKHSLPVIWIIHESQKDEYLQKFNIKEHDFQSADAVVFPAHFTHDLYSNFDVGNFHVIPNGIDTTSIETFCSQHSKEELRDQYYIPQTATVFTSIGTIYPLKGYETFVEAGIQLINKHPQEELHFFIIGAIQSPEQQMYTDHLLQRAWKSGVRSRFHIFEESPLIYDFFRLSDVYVCASHIETFPRTVLEAMAFGLPVIASNVGGVPEQIEDQHTGLLVEQGNVEQFSQAMNTLLKQPPLQKKMGESAKRKVESEFSEEKSYQHYKHLIDRLTSSKRHRIPVVHPSSSESDVSLIMRASRPDTVIAAIHSALATFPHYQEFIIAASPSLPDNIIAQCKRMPRTKVIPGTDTREEAGDLHYRLLDICSGKWIANVDDDDLWVYAPQLQGVAEDVGIIHGYYLYLNYYLELTDAEYISLEKGRRVSVPSEANGITGSSWLMRRDAWKSISPQLKDRSFNHSDWRMYYHLIRNDWRALYIPEIMGIVRRFSYDFPKGPNARCWQDTVRELEEVYATSDQR